MSDTGYFVIIHPDATIETVETPGGCDELHRLLGGFFDNAYLWDFPLSDVLASVNDIGKLIGLPINPLATYIYRNPADFIVGDFILQKIVRVGEYDELDQVPFTESEVRIVLDILTMYKKRWLIEEDL